MSERRASSASTRYVARAFASSTEMHTESPQATGCRAGFPGIAGIRHGSIDFGIVGGGVVQQPGGISNRLSASNFSIESNAALLPFGFRSCLECLASLRLHLERGIPLGEVHLCLQTPSYVFYHRGDGTRDTNQHPQDLQEGCPHSGDLSLEEFDAGFVIVHATLQGVREAPRRGGEAELGEYCYELRNVHYFPVQVVDPDSLT